MKREIAIIGSFCILVSLLLAGICFREELFPDGTDAAVQPTARPTLGVFTEEDITRLDKDNRIEWKDVAEIYLGTKQEDVIRRLGFPNENVGSGHFIDQYQCVNGDYVLIWYRRQESEEWTGFVVESIMIDDEPF
ncbi:MAG: hypothetical protein Q4C48_02040 [Lachnospiraceae bacterium]|nr:hypothetical protein [Lachnospiraceae bacterium]